MLKVGDKVRFQNWILHYSRGLVYGPPPGALLSIETIDPVPNIYNRRYFTLRWHFNKSDHVLRFEEGNISVFIFNEDQDKEAIC
jgi:hypothetical protein